MDGFYGEVVGLFDTMIGHFLKKRDVCQVSGSGCAGAHGCR